MKKLIYKLFKNHIDRIVFNQEYNIKKISSRSLIAFARFSHNVSFNNLEDSLVEEQLELISFTPKDIEQHRENIIKLLVQQVKKEIVWEEKLSDNGTNSYKELVGSINLIVKK